MTLPDLPLSPALFLFGLLGSCGGARPPAPASPPPVEPEPAEASATAEGAPAEPAPGTASGAPHVALEWSWRGPPLSAALLSEPPPSTVDPGGLSCGFTFDERTRQSTLECAETRGAHVGERRWGFDVRDGRSAAALLREGETLVVARFERTGFGVIVERFHLDRGERRWRRELAGLPVPIGGLAVQAIELAREGERVVVRGWDAGGRWAVALDANDGSVRDATVFEGTGDPRASESPPGAPVLASDLPWRWDGPELSARARLDSPTEVAVETPEGGRCRWVPERNGERSDDDRAHLECLGPDGERTWGFDDASPWPDMEGRALAIEGDVLFVLSFHRAASGASMTAYELTTGAERWTTWLRGLGPIAHSGYVAWAELRIEDGRPVVYGWEASGRYVEVLDPATGASVLSRVVPDGE